MNSAQQLTATATATAYSTAISHLAKEAKEAEGNTWIAYMDDHGESYIRQLDAPDDEEETEFCRGTKEECANAILLHNPQEVEEFYNAGEATGRGF